MNFRAFVFDFCRDLFWEGFSQNWIFEVVPKKQSCFLQGIVQVIPVYIPKNGSSMHLQVMGNDLFFCQRKGIKPYKYELLVWLSNSASIFSDLSVQLP